MRSTEVHVKQRLGSCRAVKMQTSEGSRCVRSRVMRAFLIEEQKCVKQVLAEKMSQSKEKDAPKKKKAKA
ncbi:unnamed protein product [Prorocentrum cordatum]|uniref:60S ribosomal protein L34 n=1 Tax=Prorocentrum cordatum TaxID=2364126 RepID=A0ABN9V269_9DINO|nr:unnamed protein product [Polarella glacialis]